VIELASYSDYAKLEETLRRKGFANSTNPKAPICRWVVGGVTVDVMPTDARVIGFSNKWYKEGISEAVEVMLPSNTSIKIFSPPYFLASKCEAYLGRGQGDFRTSHDIEDVITLLDGLTSFDSLHDAPESVQTYLRGKLKEFLQDDLFLESVSGHLEAGPTRTDRAKRILDFIEKY
jgi:predicted nucleotidyltransferase